MVRGVFLRLGDLGRVARLTGQALPDTQCGFRLMQLCAWATLPLRTNHFEIESELLVALINGGYAVEFVPIQPIYKSEQSKIDPLLDAWRWLKWWRQTGRIQLNAGRIEKTRTAEVG